MRLNHLDLAVPDIAATRDFFEAHLGFIHLETRGQAGLCLMRDQGGLLLVLSRRRSGDAWPKGFHIGFHLPHEHDVYALHGRLRAAGLAVEAPSVQRGALSFYFDAPGDILVEVACRP